ncbi:MAG: hypothetical protein N2114_05940 [Candidatus Goldbacteria bacterium]|nr:hypothetical protein [Candidatus Goldiibacteriota bacterium]
MEERTILYLDVVTFSKYTIDDQCKIITKICSMIKENVIDELKREKRENIDETLLSPIIAGDAFAVDFDLPESAIRVAVKLMLKIREEKFKIRIGINKGKVIKIDTFGYYNNIYGDGINYAARCCSVAVPGQIIISENVIGSENNLKKLLSEINKEINKENQNKDKLIELTFNSDKCNIKHGEEIKVYNIFDKNLNIGEKFLFTNLIIVTGDRREKKNGVPDLICDVIFQSPCIHDLTFVTKLKLPYNTNIYSDKNLFFGTERYNLFLDKFKDKTIISIGSHIVNIYTFYAMKHSFFNFQVNKEIYNTIVKLHKKFVGLPPKRKRYLSQEEKDNIFGRQKDVSEFYDKKDNSIKIGNQKIYLNHLEEEFSQSVIIKDRINNIEITKKQDPVTYGFISFARHIDKKNDKNFTIIIAGIDLTATIPLIQYFPDLDFSKTPYGAVFEIEYKRCQSLPWYERPFNINDIRNITLSYDIKELSKKIQVKTKRQDLLELINILTKLNVDMPKIQKILS